MGNLDCKGRIAQGFLFSDSLYGGTQLELLQDPRAGMKNPFSDYLKEDSTRINFPNLLLRELFCPDRKIVQKNVELTLQGGRNWAAWTQGDPTWGYNNQTDSENCQTVVRNLINVIRALEEMRVN